MAPSLVNKTKLTPDTSYILPNSILYDNNLSIKKLKRSTETGTIPIDRIESVSLVFEAIPIWLFSFIPLQVNKIFIPQCSSFGDLLTTFQNLGVNVDPFNAQVALIGRRSFVFNSESSEPTIYLLSGSISFLNDKFHKFQNKKCIAISHKHSVWQKIPSSPFGFQRISHDKCRGASNFMCLYGSTFQVKPVYSTLQRSVGDYLDHSFVPRPSYTWPLKPISHSSRLPVSHLDGPVYFPTPRLSSGWGYWSLVLAELGKILGFKRPVYHSDIMVMVPLAILVSILKGSQSFCSSVSMDQSDLTLRELPRCGDDPDSTYLPSINRVLPHDWCSDTRVAITSVKNDNALVPIHLWNDRVLPLFPSFTPQVLELLRSLVFLRLKRALLKDFTRYLFRFYPLEFTS